jgi:hypothetical protein
VTEVAAMEALGESERIARRRANLIEPDLAVEAGGLDDERVTVPATNGKALPRRPVDLFRE